MRGVFIIPTGLGCSIGGHAGDATPAAKLIAECCDELIIHPNVVNASDVNEMTPNMLYVEGSQLTRFMQGRIALKRKRNGNNVLLVVNEAVPLVINTMNAAQYTIGLNVSVLQLETPLVMRGTFDQDGRATGVVTGVDELVKQIELCYYDALAVYTPVDVDRDVSLRYYKEGGVNPWGGVEAMASRMIADKINKPVAHAPVEYVNSDDEELYEIHATEIVNPRIAAEAISNGYLHCVIKGLHNAPGIKDMPGDFDDQALIVQNIDFMVSPHGCWGDIHKACTARGIPVIVVLENKTIFANGQRHDGAVYVKNYWEAAGYIMSIKAGIKPEFARVD